MTNERSTPNTGAAFPFPNPFVGLRPFRTEESLLFFGRNEQTVELLQQLHKTRFLAVVGSSGCGKSSLIRAGLIPKLKAGFLIEDRDRWLTATMKPGDSPLRNLAESLLEATFGDTTEAMIDDFVKAIRQSGVETVTTRLAAKLGDASSNLLLLVDQFEEIFRFGVESNKPDQREEAEDFVSLMLALAAQRTLPIYVVMTMRSDFIGDCDNFYGLPEAMNHSQYLVPRLTRQQRQQAIEGPVRLFGATLTPRLLDRVLNDVGDKSDQLPVMQHALMRTWEQWQKGAFIVPPSGGGDSASEANRLKAELRTSLDVEHYEAVGTLTEALSRDAEAALESLSEDNRKISERMFQALTDTDARNRQIRRPAHLSELCAITGADRETLETIIEEFSGSGRSFLTTTKETDQEDGPLIDISHESLIRQWRQMSEWVTAETEWRDRYKRLSHDAEIHRQSGKNEDLLKGSQLASALEWQEKRNPNHAWARRYFPNLEAKVADQRFDTAINYLAESRKAREDELAAIRRTKRNRRLATAALTLLGFGLATIFGVLALNLDSAKKSAEYLWSFAVSKQKEAMDQKDVAEQEKTKAETERQKAEANYLEAERQRIAAELAKQQSDADRQKVAELLYFADMSVAQNSFANGNLSRGYELLNAYLPPSAQAGMRNFSWYYLWNEFHQESATAINRDNIQKLFIAADGSAIAITSNGNYLELQDIRSGQFLGEPIYTNSRKVAITSDGNIMASANGPTVNLWDIRSGKLIGKLTGHSLDQIDSLDFAPDGRTLASIDGSVIELWDIQSEQLRKTIRIKPEQSAISGSYDLAPAFTNQAQPAKIWNARLDSTWNAFDIFIQGPSLIAFGPDGKKLAAITSRGRNVGGTRSSSVQNLLDTSGHILYQKHNDYIVHSVAFSPDGGMLAFANSDQTVRLWNTTSGQIISTLDGHRNSVLSVAFSPDSKTLASGSEDKTVMLWRIPSGQNIASFKGHEDAVESVAFASHGATLATTSKDKTTKIWNIQAVQSLSRINTNAYSIAFSPDGKTLASASSDETVKLWDARSGQLLNTLKGHESGVLSVAFAPDGKTLASASWDNTVKLWDARSGQLLNTLNGHEDPVRSVAFAPDGKTLATASSDKTVKLWDARSGQLLKTLKGHESDVNSVAFAPDGKTLASASNDNTVKLWDARSGQPINSLKDHEAPVWSVAFAPDGKMLASAGGDSRGKKDFAIRLWRAATDADVERQRNR